MTPYDRITEVAQTMLTSGVLQAAQRCQPVAARPNSILEWQLREAWQRMQKCQDSSLVGDTRSRLESFVVLIEAVRGVVRFGIFDDIRNGMAAGVEKTNLLLLEGRARAALQSVDDMTRPDARTPMEQIRDHVQAAEDLWGGFSREERDELLARQTQEKPGAPTLGEALTYAVSAAEQLVQTQEPTEGARP